MSKPAEYRQGYSAGYAAGLKRLGRVRAEIDELQARLKATRQGSTEIHDETIDYLIDTAEVMANAARLLLAMRTRTEAEAPE